jgi:hypothetical protein
MKYHYGDARDIDTVAIYVKPGGVPDHSLPSHILRTPPSSSRQQGDKSKKFAHIDMELANYFHPKRY